MTPLTYVQNRMKNFQLSIRRKINQVEAKLSYLSDGHDQLAKAFHEFAEEIDDYIDFQMKTNATISKRLDKLERD